MLILSTAKCYFYFSPKEGGLPTFWDGDACRKISGEPVRGTKLGMVQINFKTKEVPKAHMQTSIQSIQ